MKSEKMEKIQKYTEYTCEICGNKSKYKDQIIACEARHGCSHVAKFELTEASDDFNCGYVSISVRCKKCGIAFKKFPHVTFEDFEDDQGTLRRMYILLKRRQKMNFREKTLLNYQFGPRHVDYLFQERNKI